MSLAIALQVWLEGKGDNYVPEVIDENAPRKIVDPLFEDEYDVEVCE